MTTTDDSAVVMRPVIVRRASPSNAHQQQQQHQAAQHARMQSVDSALLQHQRPEDRPPSPSGGSSNDLKKKRVRVPSQLNTTQPAAAVAATASAAAAASAAPGSGSPPSSPSPAPYTTDDFEFGDLLGEGAYSRVMLCTFKKTGKKYACKVIEKQLIVREQKHKTVQMEREVLRRMDHPNVIKLFCTFQDRDHLYFALEWAPGGELFGYISKYGGMSLEATAFYAAEIVSAMEYMHGLGIIHRDLKPENIILSKDMHAKLTDFGTAKIQNDESSKSFTADNASFLQRKHKQTFCGTAEFVSPEILKDEPCSEGSDLWALGCIIYQCLTGKHPFKAESEYLIFQKIIKRDMSFPEGFPEVARDLIDKLLQLEPEKRLGTPAMGGYRELKSHPFFAGIDWHNLNSMTPPPIGGLRDELRDVKDVKESEGDGEGGGGDDFDEGDGDDLSSTPSTPTSSQLGRSNSGLKRTSSMFTVLTDEVVKQNFLTKQEQVLFSRSVIKRRHLTAKKRQLILTDRPRLMYVDPTKLVVKGQIPWCKELKVIKKSSKQFVIQVPGRSYILDCNDGDPEEWIKAVEQVQENYRNRK